MQMDDIKPPAGNRTIRDCPSDGPVEPKATGSLAAAKDKVLAFDAAGPEPQKLGVLSRFTRTALNDPAELNNMVRDSVSELVDSGIGITGSLPEAQKGFLVDFLTEDPLLRQQIETYLRRVLT
jgi:hypothetical protein